jgi:hypothetical protein
MAIVATMTRLNTEETDLKSAVKRREKSMQVLLLGDSIRMGYLPFVRDALADRADVVGPENNCETAETFWPILIAGSKLARGGSSISTAVCTTSRSTGGPASAKPRSTATATTYAASAPGCARRARS